MGRKTTGLLLGLSLVAAGCALPGDGAQRPTDPDAPVLQIRSEHGFAPVEYVLGRGPAFTLLGDGRLIVEGPVMEIYPGPLLPGYQVVQIGADDFDRILDLVDEIGLSAITYEIDDSAASTIADATTEMVTYWDEDGVHQYGVYALGIDGIGSEPDDRNTSFLDLLALLHEARAEADPTPYEPDRVRVLMGVAMAPPDPDFEDTRPWPLDEDPANWEQLDNGWSCAVLGPEALAAFEDATQVTEWLHPDPMMDAPTYKLLVRPLHPGEEDCQIGSPQPSS